MKNKKNNISIKMTPREKQKNQDKKIFERRQKFMRDRERCYICSFVNYIKSFFI